MPNTYPRLLLHFNDIFSAFFASLCSGFHWQFHSIGQRVWYHIFFCTNFGAIFFALTLQITQPFGTTVELFPLMIPYFWCCLVAFTMTNFRRGLLVKVIQGFIHQPKKGTNTSFEGKNSTASVCRACLCFQKRVCYFYTLWSNDSKMKFYNFSVNKVFLESLYFCLWEKNKNKKVCDLDRSRVFLLAEIFVS